MIDLDGLYDDPLYPLKLLSVRNLKTLMSQATDAIEAAVGTHGEEATKALVTAITKQHDKPIALTHHPHWDADKPNAKSRITRQRTLKAPSMTQGEDGEGYNFIFFSIIPDSDTISRKANGCFLVRNPMEQMLQESVTSIMDRNNKTFLIGGNHCRTAWLINDITCLLTRKNTKLWDHIANNDQAALEKEVADNVFAHEELLVPMEVDLTNHYFVSRGKAEPLLPSSTQPKQRRSKPKSIAPDSDDLERDDKGIE